MGDIGLVPRTTIEQVHHVISDSVDPEIVSKKRNIDDARFGTQNETVALPETYIPRNLDLLGLVHQHIRGWTTH